MTKRREENPFKELFLVYVHKKPNRLISTKTRNTYYVFPYAYGLFFCRRIMVVVVFFRCLRYRLRRRHKWYTRKRNRNESCEKCVHAGWPNRPPMLLDQRAKVSKLRRHRHRVYFLYHYYKPRKISYFHEVCDPHINLAISNIGFVRDSASKHFTTFLVKPSESRTQQAAL